MKEMTVNDKILLHLHKYYRNRDEYEMPFELTQDGIAHSVEISRGHAAISLSSLKKKMFVEEKVARVKNVARQRKVYNLSPDGVAYTRELVKSIYDRNIMFKDFEGNIIEIKPLEISSYFLPIIQKYVTPLEIIKNLNEDNVFDAKTFLDKHIKGDKELVILKAKKKSKEKSKPLIDEVPKVQPILTKSQQGVVEKISHTSNLPQHRGHTLYPYNYQFQYLNNYQNAYYYYLYRQSQYPFYNPFDVKTHPPEERKRSIINDMLIFFHIGWIFIFITIIFGFFIELVYDWVSPKWVFSPIFLTFIVIGSVLSIIGIATGLSNILFIGKKGRRYLIAMGSLYVAFILLILELYFCDILNVAKISIIGPMLLIFSTVIIIVLFGKAINLEHRIEIAITTGTVSILYGFLFFLILPSTEGSNPFIYSPLWIFFGFISTILGIELWTPKDEYKILKMKKYFALGIGVLLIILVFGYIISKNTEIEKSLIKYMSAGCWIMIGAYLIGFRFMKNPLDLKMLDSIIISIPIGFGTLFILISIYLLSLNRIGEGVIELIIGLAVIGYGIPKNLISKDFQRAFILLGFPVLLCITEFVTFHTIVF